MVWININWINENQKKGDEIRVSVNKNYRETLKDSCVFKQRSVYFQPPPLPFFSSLIQFECSFFEK